MRIAIAHYRYFQGDGPERYLFNIKEILERQGHDVPVFSIHNSRNLPSPWEQYFLPGVDDEVHYGDKTSTSPRKALASLQRMYWSGEARRMFGRFLDAARPDVVYILQYHNKISPSILGAARRRGIPVVHRISDFQYMCPNALFFRQGEPCEACLHGGLRGAMSCITGRCVHGSAVMSALKLGAKLYHDAAGFRKQVSAFVVPSAFTLGKLAEYGIPEERLHHIPTFYNGPSQLPVSPGLDAERNSYFLYIGRLAPQKGLDTLIRAFNGSGMRLKLIGTAADEQYMSHLVDMAEDNIEFVGYKPFDEIFNYVNACIATIVPSEWYDNFPNSVLESYGFGRPVIASRIGSLTAMVEEGHTGMLFTPGDSDDLRRCARHILDYPEDAAFMGRNGRRLVDTVYSPATHYRKLITLFESLL